jgi:hydroxymethylbilane synthase
VIALVARKNDDVTRDLLGRIDHRPSSTALTAERAFLAVLDGSCRTPIGGHAKFEQGTLRFHGIIIKPDGSEAFEVLREGAREAAAELGADAGGELCARAGADFFVRA